MTGCAWELLDRNGHGKGSYAPPGGEPAAGRAAPSIPDA